MNEMAAEQERSCWHRRVQLSLDSAPIFGSTVVTQVCRSEGISEIVRSGLCREWAAAKIAMPVCVSKHTSFFSLIVIFWREGGCHRPMVLGDIHEPKLRWYKAPGTLANGTTPFSILFCFDSFKCHVGQNPTFGASGKSLCVRLFHDENQSAKWFLKTPHQYHSKRGPRTSTTTAPTVSTVVSGEHVAVF